eukprot:c19964_g4_i1 orf=379-663(-)
MPFLFAAPRRKYVNMAVGLTIFGPTCNRIDVIMGKCVATLLTVVIGSFSQGWVFTLKQQVQVSMGLMLMIYPLSVCILLWNVLFADEKQLATIF